jgi:hypothetical protein
MARHESDREDLFAEATAYDRRAEFIVGDSDQPILFGEKADGAWSLYLSLDPVFHFDAIGRLKRAFVDGRLYRTQGDTLAELTRERSDQVTVLRRRDLPEIERDRFLALLRIRLTALLTASEGGEVRVLRAEPADSDLLFRLVTVIRKSLAAADAAFLAPRFRGKR